MNKKNSIIAIVVLVVITAVAVYQIVQKRQSNQAEDAASTQKVADKDFGLSFSYKGGENGFTLVEPPANQVGILKAYLLLPSKAYEEYKTKEIAGEAPAGMNIFVFTMDENKATTTDSAVDSASTTTRVDRLARLKEWAITNTTITSYTSAKAAPETVEIDGLKMLRYQADGLYQQDIYLGSYKNRAYMFVGQYNEESDQTFTAFQELMSTVSFD